MGTTGLDRTERKAAHGAAMQLDACPSPVGVRRLSDQELFRRLIEHEDARAREALLERFLPLARKLARRYARTSEALEDVTQVANMGLLKAIDRFDPDRGRAFATFAIPTVLGEIRRYLRDCSWSVHVVRSAQERSMEVRKAIDALESERASVPTVQQLAQYLEIEQSDVLDGLEVLEARRAASLDAPVEDDPANASLLDQMGSTDRNYERVEARLSASPAIESLSERDRGILAMGYIAEMTQVEIGAKLGVSQMQVSRLMRRALGRAQEVASASGAAEQ